MNGGGGSNSGNSNSTATKATAQQRPQRQRFGDSSSRDSSRDSSADGNGSSLTEDLHYPYLALGFLGCLHNSALTFCQACVRAPNTLRPSRPANGSRHRPIRGLRAGLLKKTHRGEHLNLRTPSNPWRNPALLGSGLNSLKPPKHTNAACTSVDVTRVLNSPRRTAAIKNAAIRNGSRLTDDRAGGSRKYPHAIVPDLLVISVLQLPPNPSWDAEKHSKKAGLATCPDLCTRVLLALGLESDAYAAVRSISNCVCSACTEGAPGDRKEIRGRHETVRMFAHCPCVDCTPGLGWR